jgi:hypothetical protein
MILHAHKIRAGLEIDMGCYPIEEIVEGFYNRKSAL